MTKIITSALIALALSVSFVAPSAEAKSKPSKETSQKNKPSKPSKTTPSKLGGGLSFDGTLTGGFANANRTGKAWSDASNENFGQSETTVKNGKVTSEQNTGSYSTSGSRAKNNGSGSSSSGGFGAALGLGLGF